MIGAYLLYPYHAISPTSQGFGATVIGTPGHGKLLALTYDDGPNPRWTPELLDLLAEHGVKATFFVVGKYVEREPELVRRTIAEGHAVGNHTYSHTSIFRLSKEEIASELARCAAAVTGAGCEFSEVPEGKLCRPPYGRKRPAALRAVRAEGYVPVLWSVTCWDWSKRATADTIWRHARKQTRGGDVILLHDGCNVAMGWDRSHSIEATDRILTRWKGQGMRFVTVPELIEATGFVVDPVGEPLPSPA
jgi:peptidoglycan/xylan/chitin deacetylase (PgdA/CDA1 family)